MSKIGIALLLGLISLPARAATDDAKHEIALAVTNASSVAIISLEPDGARDSDGACAGFCYFGWPVLGLTVASPAAAKSIRNDLSAWVAAPEPKAVNLCFNPRHGIRLVANGHTYDFVVCFECDQAQVFKDSSAEPLAYFYYTAQQKEWDAALSAAHVPLAAPADADGS